MQAEKQIANEPSATRQELQFVLGAGLIAFLLFAYYFYTWRNAYNFRAALDVCAQPFCDFATFYYPMGEAIFQTKLPIDGFVYSPFIAILLAAFPPIGLDVSLLLWSVLQVLFIILYLFAFRWHPSSSPTSSSSISSATGSLMAPSALSSGLTGSALWFPKWNFCRARCDGFA